MRLPILQLVLQEVFQREVNDALILTGIHELCRIHLSYGDFVAQPYKMLVNQNNEVLQSFQYFFFFAFVNLYKGNVFVDYTKQNRKKKAFRSLQ